MALPAVYDEEALAQYMHSVLGDSSDVLGWTAEESYSEPINDVLLLMDAATVEEIADLIVLRAAARWAVWSQVAAAVALGADFASDGQSMRRSQRLAGAGEMLRRAEDDLIKLGIDPAGRVLMFGIDHVDGPFRVPQRGAEFG